MEPDELVSMLNKVIVGLEYGDFDCEDSMPEIKKIYVKLYRIYNK